MSISDKLRGASSETTIWGRWFARFYLLLLIGLVLGGLGGLYHFGYLSFDITVSADIQIGWILEGLVLVGSALFVLFTSSMLVKATGGKTLSAVVSVVARIADNYQLEQVDNLTDQVDQEDDENQGS